MTVGGPGRRLPPARLLGMRPVNGKFGYGTIAAIEGSKLE